MIDPTAPPPRSALDFETGCDFYCLRFQVWYPSRDCAERTQNKTYHGCLDCDQGRFNLRRHQQDLSTPRALRCL